MKKHFWYLFILICYFHFTGCDDKDDKTKGWLKHGNSFSSGTLTINGKGVGEEATVLLEESFENKARITFNHVIIDKEVWAIDDLEITEENGNYFFESSKIIGETEVFVTGALTSPSIAGNTATLALTINRKILSDMPGIWHLLYNDEESRGEFHIDYVLKQGLQPAQIESAQISWMFFMGKIHTFLNTPNVLAQRVEKVTFTLREEGTIALSWTQHDHEPVRLSDLLAGFGIPVEYYTCGNQVIVGVDRQLLDLVPILYQFAPAAEVYSALMNLIIATFTVQGRYAVLAVDREEMEKGSRFTLAIPGGTISPLFSSLIALTPIPMQEFFDEKIMDAMEDMMKCTDYTQIALDFAKE